MSLVITLLIFSLVFSWIATPRFSQLLQTGGAVKKNYAGNQIPNAAGISIVSAAAAAYLVAAVVSSGYRFEIMAGLAVILGMGLLGLIDDLLGTRDTTGIKGHLSMLLKGRLTTGGLKALFGGGLALGFSLIFSGGAADTAINTLLIGLFTNAINLTDLRPGRAGKVFLFVGTIFLVIALVKLSQSVMLLAPVYGAVIAFLPFDLKGQVMMGDTGSNVLGITLGVVSVLLFDITGRMVLLGLLILLHIYTEKHSLTETIQRIKFLRLIDEWGTPR